jgi:hypothetical protein
LKWLAQKRHWLLDGIVLSGLLAAPFDFSVATKGGYYISFSDTKEKSQKIIEFEHWLLQEVMSSP